jgi:hypothetical protein
VRIRGGLRFLIVKFLCYSVKIGEIGEFGMSLGGYGGC